MRNFYTTLFIIIIVSSELGINSHKYHAKWVSELCAIFCTSELCALVLVPIARKLQLGRTKCHFSRL